jgi:hypothetical protein
LITAINPLFLVSRQWSSLARKCLLAKWQASASVQLQLVADIMGSQDNVKVIFGRLQNG